MKKARFNRVHGLTNTRFWNIWSSMKQRTMNKNNSTYHSYGGRGIKLCPRWREFVNFRDDMYASYLAHVEQFGEKDTTIDRINGDKHYTPGNCRWATRAEQHTNKPKKFRT